MSYDEGLAVRIEDILQDRDDVEMKKMFGGIAFMVNKHMTVGIIDDMLMARVGPDQYEKCLKEDFVKEMTFTGKAMKGMVYVLPEGIAEDQDLTRWVNLCLDFINTLPNKK